jgi:hypothetical protein
MEIWRRGSAAHRRLGGRPRAGRRLAVRPREFRRRAAGRLPFGPHLAVRCLAVQLLLAGAAGATPAGRLAGTVTDAQGGLLPGATVTAASPALIGGARLATSGADGSFVFPALDPGLYRVRVELAGFRAADLPDVRVALGRTTAVHPRLEAGEMGESITVNAERPLLDPTRVATGQIFNAEFVDRASIGADDRTYLSVLGSAAGVTSTELAADPKVLGSTEGENVYLVDGLDTTDPYRATFGLQLNFDAIEEVSLLAAGFEAEYGRATGGLVNLITKSGGNQFAGTLDTRYRNRSFVEKGRHFDPESATNSFLLPAATLGGPLLRDRLWFFTSAAYQDQTATPSGSPLADRFTQRDFLGKLSWQIDERWRAVFKASSTPSRTTNFNASQFVAPEAGAVEKQSSTVYLGDATAMLAGDLLWELQLGVTRRAVEDGPRGGDLATPGVFDQSTGQSSVNYPFVQANARRRGEAQSSLSWLGGRHEVKAGASYARLALSALANTVGGAVYTDDNGPLLLSVTPPLPAQDYTGSLAGGYLQDAWSVSPSLTLKAGLRYDRAGYADELGRQVATLGELQPRLGFAWSLGGDARTLLRGGYGLFMHPSALSLPQYARVTFAPTTRYVSCSQVVAPGVADPAQLAALCQAYAGARGGAVIADPLGRDPAGYAFFDQLSSQPNQVDPHLRPTVAGELTLGIERQLGAHTAVEASYVYKRTRHIIEDTCSENVPRPTPDPGFTGCPYRILTNPAAARRDYHGLVLRLDSRAADWLNVTAAYTYSLSRGSIEYTQGSGPDFDIYPVHFTNAYGYLSDDRRHRVRVKGYVKLPFDLAFAANATYESPFDYSVLRALDPPLYGSQFLAPRGSRRANANYYLEVELRKAFRLGRLELDLIGTLENVLGTEQPLAVCQLAAGCTPADGDTLALGQPIAYQAPRTYEVGVRLVF